MHTLERLIHRWTIEERTKLRAVAKLSHLKVKLLDGELLEKSDDGGALHGGPHQWNYDEFVALREDPAFAELDLEVLDGELIYCRGRVRDDREGPRRLAQRLRASFAVADGFAVHERMPLCLDLHTAVVPDVALTYGTAPSGGRRQEWLLLVDVAHDWPPDLCDARARWMARHRVAEYWYVDPARRKVETRKHPARNWAHEPSWCFEELRTHLIGEVIQPHADHRLQVEVDDLIA